MQYIQNLSENGLVSRSYILTEFQQINNFFKKTHSLKESKHFKRDFPGSSDRKESSCSTGGPGSISGSGRSPGEGNGNPLQ